MKEAKAKFNDALKINSAMAAANVNKGVAEHSLMNLESAKNCFDLALRTIQIILMQNGINLMFC